MFIGHFAVAVAAAAKTRAPRASLGSFIAASFFLDALWPVFVLLGIETFQVDPGNTAFTPLRFVSYPWSHSLAMALVWSIVFGGVHYAIRKDALTAKWLAGVVLSHWVLDAITHRPDLPLLPGLATRVGLGLWNSVPATVAIEGTMFAGAVWLYARATQPLDRVGRWAWIAFVSLLAIVYAANLGPPPAPGQETLITWVTIGMIAFVPWGGWIDRHRSRDHFRRRW